MIDPSLYEFVEDTRQFNERVKRTIKDLGELKTLEEIKERRVNPGFLVQPQPVEHAIVREVPGPAGPIGVRVLVPPTVQAVYLDIHGGGWVFGSAWRSDRGNWALAQAADVAVVSVDYRLAPEDPYPAGPDDCEAVAAWLLTHAASEFGADRLIIGGASAGAHLAALTLLRMRDRHAAIDRFLGANLVFGAYDLSLTPSARRAVDPSPVSAASQRTVIGHFLPGRTEGELRDPEYSPLYADLTGLPPALFTVGTGDPLLDDSLFMAARWEAAGNDAELAVYPEGLHGFVAAPTRMAQAARSRIQSWVAKRARA